MTAHVGSRRPFRLPSGAGESVWSLGGRFTVKADSAATENRFSLLELVAFRSTEPPLHIHHHEDEAWYVLDEPPPGLAIPPPEVMAPFRARYGIEIVGPPRRTGGAGPAAPIPEPR